MQQCLIQVSQRLFQVDGFESEIGVFPFTAPGEMPGQFRGEQAKTLEDSGHVGGNGFVRVLFKEIFHGLDGIAVILEDLYAGNAVQRVQRHLEIRGGRQFIIAGKNARQRVVDFFQFQGHQAHVHRFAPDVGWLHGVGGAGEFRAGYVH